MVSIRHSFVDERPPTAGDAAYLDAARAAILAVGLKRTTLTDVARRAGVSRMTIYRRWPDMAALLADLLVREWTTITDTALASAGGETVRHRLSRGVVHAVRALRGNPVFQRIVDVDPELLLPYLLQRRGRNQDNVLALLEDALARGQRDGSVRPGSPATLARTLVLALHGAVLSAHTMTGPTPPATEPATPPATEPVGVSLEDLDDELIALVERYLAPSTEF